MAMPAKDELRSTLLAARRARQPAERERARTAIADLVLARAAQDRWRSVAAYVPMTTEPGSVELLRRLTRAGVRVIVPILLADRDLDWTQWPADGGLLGTDAVAAVHAVLVPALAATTGGTRLGRGGGSYDRALARVRAEVPRVALLFDGELLDELPRDPWDQPVTAVVTPAGWRDLNPPC